jgi:hypothetical protein
MKTSRRTFLSVLGAGSAASWVGLSPLAVLADAKAGAGPGADQEFFVFIHAAGGWDVTLWSDPRNEKKGLVAPASTENTDTSQLKRWVDAPLGDGFKTFELVKVPGKGGVVFGPGIGDMLELFDRITVVNGLAMNTVSHPDGSAFSATGRHLVGGHVPSASIDTMLANESGKEQLLPAVSVQFPSSFVGDNLDRRVVPLVVGNVGAVSRTLTRPQLYDDDAERDLVTAMLSEEARDLAKRSAYPTAINGFALQYEALRKMLGSKLQDVFSSDGLTKAHPDLPYKSRFVGSAAINVAFAVEAAKRNLVRCISFAVGGFDTHGPNYKTHALLQQETMGLLSQLVKALDATPHPTKPSAKLSEHTHIMVISDFCRTPQINLGMGRDHYPNNSALVISPRFRGGVVFGKSDPEQLLPTRTRKFADGDRAIAPPDLLATFLAAFSVEPRKYMRDGEVVPELLRG